MKRGGITIFLALILSVVLSLVLTVIEGARINAMRLQIECVTDLGLDSAFAEYNRQLLEQYDLFFIDTTYGKKRPSFHRIGEHIEGYMGYNLEPSKELPVFFIRDWLELSIEDILILEVSVATDQKGAVFKAQAIDYMKDRVGISLLSSLGGQIDLIDEKDLLNYDLEAKQRENQRKINQVELPLEEVEEGKWEEVSLDNPADIIKGQKSKGILSLVIEDKASLSQKKINLSQSLSQRNVVKGNGISPNKKEPDGMTAELLFGEYLMEKFGTYINIKNQGALSYQIEYILSGQDNDIDNVKEVANKILLLRQAANAITLYSDSVRVAEADGLALIIATGLTVPYLQPLIKNSLLLAWIYAESIGDVKDLLEGGKVPLIKKRNQWQLSFQNMLDNGAKATNRGSGTEGVTYETYLRMLLGKLNSDQKVLRAMEMIEMDIRKTKGNRNFKMDGCVDSIMAQVEMKSREGYEFSIQRRYEY